MDTELSFIPCGAPTLKVGYHLITGQFQQFIFPLPQDARQLNLTGR